MRIALPALCVLLFGCGWIADITRAPTQALGNLLLSQEQEEQLGSQMDAQIRQQQDVLDVPQVQACVDRIGRRLLEEAEGEPQFDYTFTVIDGPDTVNAFAIPGGNIYVFSGLIRAAESEAELASVLAHEIGHVKAGHVSDQLAAQVGVGTLQQLALGGEPGLLAQLASGIAAQGYLAAYSRDAEREADEIGLQLLVGAGYDPMGMVQFFERLEELRGSSPGFVERFFATHPAPGERAERIRGQLDDGGRGQPTVGCFDEMQAALGS